MTTPKLAIARARSIQSQRYKGTRVPPGIHEIAETSNKLRTMDLDNNLGKSVSRRARKYDGTSPGRTAMRLASAAAIKLSGYLHTSDSWPRKATTSFKLERLTDLCRPVANYIGAMLNGPWFSQYQFLYHW